MEIFIVIIVTIVLALVLYVVTRPKIFRVARTGIVNASPDTVFPLINNFREWTCWSPWENRDLALQRTYDGPPMGPGAVYSWVGNKEVGSGRMTLIDSKAGESVEIMLEFFKPFAATNKTLFKLTPVDGNTRVDWSMEGKNMLAGKILSIFINMDKLVGKDFEQGLVNLDNAAMKAKTGTNQ